MQEKLLQECLLMEYTPVILDKNQNVIASRYPCTILHADISDPDQCVDVCIRFAKKIKRPPNAAITVGTDFPLSVSAICEAFGLPGVPPLGAQNTGNKIQMRNTLLKKNICQPHFYPILQKEDLLKSASTIGFPLVIKPADNMGARGVCRVNSVLELEKAYREASFFSRSNQVLAESLVVGTEFSLDALIFDGKVHVTGVADRIISHDPYFVEIGHDLPSNASSQILEKVQNIFVQAIQALGISYGFAKGDIFWDVYKKRAVVGEIAARLSGGFMSSYTYPQASGVNLMKNALLIALGDTTSINVDPTRKNVSLERAIFANKSGRILDIQNVEKTLSLEGVTHLFIHKKQGDFVHPPRNNVEKIANLLVCSTNYALAQKNMDAALKILKIIVDENESSVC